MALQLYMVGLTVVFGYENQDHLALTISTSSA
jgi:hypothetical protein